MTVRTRSTVFGLTAMVVALSLFAGCGKKKAEGKIEEAQAVKQEADGQRMSVYMPDQYKLAQGMLDGAISLKDEGSYDESVAQAEQAIGRFQGSMTQLATLRAEIDELWGQIEERRQTIEEHLATAREQGLVPDNEIEELNGELYFINDRDDAALKKPERNGSVDREFLTQVVKDYDVLSTKTLAAAKAHLKPQAEEALTAVREKWSEVQSLEAERYKPDLFAEMKAAVASLEEAESSGNWEAILDKGDATSASLDTLLQQTRIAASDVKVQEAQSALEAALQIQAPDVTDYGRLLSDAGEALKRAKDAQAGGQAADAFSAADEVLAMVEEADAALGEQVQISLDAADSSLQDAIAKEARTYATGSLSSAEGLVSAAKSALAEDRFADAYKAAEAAKAAAAKVVTEARAGKAKTLLSGVESRLRALVAQGARERASGAYGEAQEVIGGLQAALESGDYERVTAGVPAAGEAINAVRDAMAVAAAKAIEDSDKALAQAEKADTEVRIAQSPAKSTLAEARRARGEAADALENSKFGAVFSQSQAAAKLAARAETEAYTSGAESALSQAASTLGMAREADAPVQSPQAYRSALDLETSAKDALGAGQAQLAYRRSLEARRAAQDALDDRINTAAKAVDDAREAHASTYAPDDLRKGEALYNQARAAHKQHDFDRANSLVQQAAAASAAGEAFAWRQRSTALLAELDETEAQLAQHDATGKAPEAAVAFGSHVAKGRAAHLGREWEKAYAEAAAADQAASDAWQAMDNEIQARLAAVRNLLETMAEIADDPDEFQAVDALTEQVEPVLNAQALNDYNLAYDLSGALLSSAGDQLDDMEWQNRDQAADHLSNRLSERKSEGSAEVLAEEAAELEAFIAELLDKDSEIGYFTLMAQLEAWEGRLDTMPERALEDAAPRLDQVTALFASARENDAAKLYPEHLRELEGDYNMTQNAVLGGDVRDVADRLIALEQDAQDIEDASRLAKSEADYKTEIASFLKQQQNLIRDFGRIASLNDKVMTALRATTTTLEDEVTNAYESMQSVLSARAFKRNAALLEERVRATTPPDTSTMKRLYKLSCKSFYNLRLAATGFEAFGDSDRYDLGYRNQRIEASYGQLENVLRVNEEIEFILASTPETTWREKWTRKSRVAKRAMHEALYDEFQFKTDQYEDRFFRFFFRVEDVQRQVR